MDAKWPARLAKLSMIEAALGLLLATWTAEPAVAISKPSETLDASLRLTPHLDRGAEIFQTCAACHGTNAWGASDGSVPAVAGQSSSVLIEQIIEFRYDARDSIRMQHFTQPHHLATPQDVADVAGYIASLPPREPTRESDRPRGAAGASLFADFCARCHGRRAEGRPAERIPRLAAQHSEYLQEELHDAAEGRRPSMEPDHTRLLARRSREDIDAIAQYLAGLAPTGTDPHDDHPTQRSLP